MNGMRLLQRPSFKKRFKAMVLRTFGKLSEEDIENIDGQPERLFVELTKHYQWAAEVTRKRVARFNFELGEPANADRPFRNGTIS